MNPWLRLAAPIGVLVMTPLFSGCCNHSGDSPQETQEPTVYVPTPKMPPGWSIERNFVASKSETATLSTQMKAQLAGVRNTVYSVKGGRVQLNTLRATNPREAFRVVRYLLSIKPSEFVLRNKNIVYEFVGRNDVLPSIKAGREHLLKSRQAFPIKASPGDYQKRIKRRPLKGHDGGAPTDADTG